MTPKQRRKKLAAFKANKTKKTSWQKFIYPAILLGAALIYVWSTAKTFNKNSKLAIVVNRKDEVVISTFDKSEGSIINVVIPGNTQVNVARQLGTWKIASVWRLGENEKVTGALLAETVLKNFRVPVSGWADSPFSGISNGGPLKIAKGLFGYKTSLGVGDRVRLGLFSLTVPPVKRINIDLSERGFLKKTRLVGGEEGYLISGELPKSLYYVFADAKINELNPRILIEDYEKREEALATLAGTLEVLGAKATSVVKNTPKEFLCEVRGNNDYAAYKISAIFGCSRIKSKLDNNFDLTIRIGTEFAKRF